jgi:hypothetical protein
MAIEWDLDHFFWNAIRTNLQFQSWFIQRTKFSECALALVTDEKWYHRRYWDSVTKRDSETDILLIFKDLANHERYAIHIENRPPNREWEPLQAENNRMRAMNRTLKWRYIDFQIALIAPFSFIARSAREVEHFDIAIAYEDISKFVPEFGLYLPNTGPE